MTQSIQEPETPPAGGASSGPSSAAPLRAPAAGLQIAPNDDMDVLPTYGRSLMRIKVPVMVTLAAKKQPVGKIIELVPGSIVQFQKSCDEMLELEVSGRRVALGECVKVGDKFGLRITSFVLPDERFEKVPGAASRL